MAVSVVASVNASLSATRSPTATFASWTPTTDDLVLLFVTVGTVPLTFTAPTGWVSGLGGSTDVESDSHACFVIYHWVTGTEQTNGTLTYTATNTFGSNLSGGTLGVVLRGVNTTTPIDDSNTTFDSGTVTPHVIVGLPTGANLSTGSFVLGYVCADGTQTYATAPTGWTFVVKGAGGQQGRAVCSLNTTTTAGVAVSSANITPLAADEYASITLAFTVSGPTNFNGSGSLTATATATGNGVVATSRGSSAVTVTATITGAGSVAADFTGTGTAVTVTATATGAGVVGTVSGSSAVTITATATGGGAIPGGPPTWVSLGTLLSGSSSTTANVPVPATSVLTGLLDLVLLYVEDTEAVTPPLDFAAAPESPMVVSAGAQSFNLHVFYRRPSGSETGTYGFTVASGLGWRSGISSRYSGVIASGSPFDTGAGAPDSAIKTTTTNGNTNAVSLTTQGADRLLVWMAATFPGATCTTVTGFDERVNLESWAIDDKTQAVAGATGSLTATFSANGPTAAWLGALLPTAGVTDYPGGGSLTVTAAATGAGVVAASSASTLLSVALTAIGVGVVDRSTTGVALTVTATSTGAGVVAIGGGSTALSATATATGSGAVGITGDGSLTCTAYAVGDGVVATTGTGTALTATATATGDGVAGLSGTATALTVTAAATGAGVVGAVGTSTLSATATATGAGVVALTGSGSLTVTATITGTPEPAATPTIVGYAVAGAGSGNSLTFNKSDLPTLADNDYLVAFLRCSTSSTSTLYSCTGFTLLAPPSYTVDSSGRLIGAHGHVVATASSEPSTWTFTFTGTGGRNAGILLLVRGVDTSAPVSGYAGNGTQYYNHGNFGGGWTTTVDSLILAAAANEVVSPNSSTPTAVDSDYTTVAVHPHTTGTGVTRTVVWVGSKTADSLTAPSSGGTAWASTSSLAYWSLSLLGFPTAPEEIPGFPNVASALAYPGATMAHRGASDTPGMPEMSERAYDYAVAQGYGILEFSANRTSDGVWVGCHDADLDRTSETPTADISAMTWATVQTYENSLNDGGTPVPYYRLDDFLDKYTPTHVCFVDPKFGVGSVTDFLDLLDAHGGPTKIVVKFFGVGSGSNALADAATGRGYQTWGYYYEADYTDGDLAANQSHWSVLGMEYDASAAAWYAVQSYDNKRVVAHIAGSQANYDTAITNGADLVQCSRPDLIAAVSSEGEEVRGGYLTATATITGAGAIGVGGTGSTLTATATVTGAGVVATSQTATSTTTAVVTGDGVVATFGSGSLTVTAEAQGSAVGEVTGTGSFTADAVITGDGVVALTGAGSLTVTATATGAGSAAGDGTLTTTATITGAGVVGVVGTGALSVTATGTGLGESVGTGSGSLTVTATITGSGVRNYTAGGVRVVTANRTGAGVVGRIGAGTRTVTATITGAGVVGRTGAGTATVTATITGAGVVGAVGSGPVTVTASATGTGVVGHAGAFAAIAIITGTGVVGIYGSGTLTITTVITGSPEIPMSPLHAARIITLLQETRTVTITSENRTITLTGEVRTITLPRETRTITVDEETRTVTVPRENRTITMPRENRLITL